MFYLKKDCKKDLQDIIQHRREIVTSQVNVYQRRLMFPLLTLNRNVFCCGGFFLWYFIYVEEFFLVWPILYLEPFLQMAHLYWKICAPKSKRLRTCEIKNTIQYSLKQCKYIQSVKMITNTSTPNIICFNLNYKIIRVLLFLNGDHVLFTEILS